jgi:ubiquinone/menaquinone biosynthesis C-methylase UbiE
MDYDKTKIPETYNQVREHGPAFLKQWMEVVGAHVDEDKVEDVLDLGCGTGRFSQGLAAHLHAKVFGIDPSQKMLAKARENLTRGDVFYACGSAEALPLRNASVDVIFISMAFHHFSDTQLAAQECRRVLRKDGRLCLRTGSRDRVTAYPYVPYFPASRALLEAHLPSVEAQCDAFRAASFQVVFSGIVTQQIATDYADYARKLSTKSDSILIRLKDADFEAGLHAVQSETSASPITEPIDFVVFCMGD